MSTNVTTRQRTEATPESRTSHKVDSVHNTDQNEQSNSSINFGAFILLALIFAASLLYFYAIYSHFPSLQDNEKEFIKLPRNMHDAKQLGIVLKKYSNSNFYSVLVAFFSAYVL